MARRGRPTHAQRDGDEQQARQRVHYLVRRGVLPPARELPCVDCGRQATEYDHPSYAAGQHEIVDAVCRACHGRRLRRQGRGLGPDTQMTDEELWARVDELDSDCPP